MRKHTEIQQALVWLATQESRPQVGMQFAYQRTIENPKQKMQFTVEIKNGNGKK
jgi:hypothetical protein